MSNKKIMPCHIYKNGAIVCSVIVALIGIFVSIFLDEWMCFGRSGSVITVIAIYFASCEFRKKIEKAPSLANEIFDENKEQYLEIFQHEISAENKEKILNLVKTQAIQEIEQISKDTYDKFLKVETVIFIVGTLIWGFGDLLNLLFQIKKS